MSSTSNMTYEIDHGLKLIKTRWLKSVTSQEYREGMLQVYELVNTHGLELWLYDASNRTAPDIADQHWMATTFTSLLSQTKIKKIAAILSNDLILQAVTEKTHEKAKPHMRSDSMFETFLDASSAKEWLLS